MNKSAKKKKVGKKVGRPIFHRYFERATIKNKKKYVPKKKKLSKSRQKKSADLFTCVQRDYFVRIKKI